ncbi:hypothetical protein CDAR_248741 [Caerostris darwini]|uniref:Uncharacterized protein n=1 Tax=Caerostris darwini TaxID=1538125 RepID=A0AAV4MSK8_9ARAC|nr:hypothetical protein CDAR_248741 [Caerostris darwini]
MNANVGNFLPSLGQPINKETDEIRPSSWNTCLHFISMDTEVHKKSPEGFQFRNRANVPKPEDTEREDRNLTGQTDGLRCINED